MRGLATCILARDVASNPVEEMYIRASSSTGGPGAAAAADGTAPFLRNAGVERQRDHNNHDPDLLAGCSQAAK
jgi:hypothetical protein